MKQNELTILNESGALENACIVHAMLSEKWNIQIDVTKEHGFKTVVLHSKRGNVREFSSLRACIKTLKEIGMSEAIIVFK